MASRLFAEDGDEDGALEQPVLTREDLAQKTEAERLWERSSSSAPESSSSSSSIAAASAQSARTAQPAKAPEDVLESLRKDLSRTVQMASAVPARPKAAGAAKPQLPERPAARPPIPARPKEKPKAEPSAPPSPGNPPLAALKPDDIAQYLAKETAKPKKAQLFDDDDDDD